MTEMTKECEACGAKFTTTNKLQKYCPDCGSHGLRIKKKYDRNIAKSIRYENLVSPKVYENTCKICGTLFKTTYKDRFICSDKCGIVMSKQKLHCSNCNKKLIDVIPIDDIPNTECRKRIHFCNDTCRQEYEKRIHPARTCKNCGKTYHNKNKYFCCNDCQIKYKKTHKGTTNVPKPVRTPKQKRVHRCYICGEYCTDPYFRMDNINGIYTTRAICSNTCLQKYNILKDRHEKKESEKKLANYIKENGCCGICITPYSECERMQSEFRIIPKGAKYENSKIVSCPKFKTKFKP